MEVPAYNRPRIPPELLTANLLVENLLCHLSTREIFRASTVCKSFRDAVKAAAQNEHAPLRTWGRLEAQTRHQDIPDSFSTPWDMAFGELSAETGVGDDKAGEARTMVVEGTDGAMKPTKAPLLLRAAELAEGFFAGQPPSLTTQILLEEISPLLGSQVAHVVQALLDHPSLRNVPSQHLSQPGTSPVKAPPTPGASQRDSPPPAEGGTPGGTQGGGRGLGVWGALLLAVMCSDGGKGVDGLVRWMWERSQPLPTHRPPPLPRRAVREFLCSLLVLLRYKWWGGKLPAGTRAAHGFLLSAMLHQEAMEVEEANQGVKGVAEWRSVVTPLPSSRVRLQDGRHLTCEQQTIIQTALPFTVGGDGELVYPRPFPNRNICIKAFAGCGKTTTLKALAQAHPDVRFLYTAYNKHVVDAARERFPANVDCFTTHTLANAVKSRLEGMGKVLRRGSLLRSYVLSATNAFCKEHYPGRGVNFAAADVINKTLEKFLGSADEEVSAEHLPPPQDIPRNVGLEPDILVHLGQHLWERMKCAEDAEAKFTFNGYLHMFMEENPVLTDDYGMPYDCILVDEAQDLNGLTSRLLLSQRCLKILVGDPHQHIYSFNHCCDVLGDPAVQWHRTFRLSVSFRVGPQIAAAANKLLLQLKREKGFLLGMGPPVGVVYRPVAPEGPVELFEQAPLLGGQPSPTPFCPLRIDALPCVHPRVPSIPARSPRPQVCVVARTNAGWFELAASLALAQERAEGAASEALQAFRRAQQELEMRREGAGAGEGQDDAAATEGGAAEEHSASKEQLCQELEAAEHVMEQAAQRAARALRECSYFLLALDNESQYCPLFQRVIDVHTFIYSPHSPKPPSLASYRSQQELRSSVEAGTETEMKAALKLVDRYGRGAKTLVELVKRRGTKKRTEAAFLLGTTHKMKGEEFPYVQLADDFWRLSWERLPSSGTAADTALDEYNCLYVAATRAQHGLILNSDLAMWMGATASSGLLSVRVRDPQRLRQLAARAGMAVQGGDQGPPAEAEGGAAETALAGLHFACPACSTPFHPHDDTEVDVFCDGRLLCAPCAQGTTMAELVVLRAPQARRRLQL